MTSKRETGGSPGSTSEREPMETEHPEARPPHDHPGPAADLDRISLEQALRDFDVANARVLDLTRRLTTMSSQLSDSQTQVATLRIKIRKMEQTRLAAAKAPSRSNPLRPIAHEAARALRRVKAELRK